MASARITLFSLGCGYKVRNSGVDFIAICSNTMHKCIPAIREKTNIPLLHIVDATAKEMLKNNIDSALLLGTRFTMEEEFNIKRFKENGISIIVPRR